MTGDVNLTHIRDAARWCPEHHMPDCSPLLNGCNKVNRQMSQVERAEAVIQAARAMCDQATRASSRGQANATWITQRSLDDLAASLAALEDGQ